MKCNKCEFHWGLACFEVYNAKSAKTGARYRTRCGHCLNCGALDAQVTRHRRRGELPELYTPDYRAWGEKVKACNGLCPKCGEKKRLTIDHITPFSRGGLFDMANFSPLCKRCNSSKGAKIP